LAGLTEKTRIVKSFRLPVGTKSKIDLNLQQKNGGGKTKTARPGGSDPHKLL
jgi:hypothetical protein